MTSFVHNLETFVSISAMPVYMKKSPEELRWEGGRTDSWGDKGVNINARSCPYQQ
jgi:hypothetical protein